MVLRRLANLLIEGGNKSFRKEKMPMSTYEAISLMLTFGLFVVGLVGLMYKMAQKK